MSRAYVAVVVVLLASVLSVSAQQSASPSDTVIPTLVNFSGVLTALNGKPLTGIVGVTFFLYKDPQGGAPLWMETQNVQPSKSGQYSVVLGSTTAAGLPADLFASGEARWLGVQAQGQEEQSRVMLLSVPYAMKAADAQTLGGLPASAFMLVAPPTGGTATGSASSQNPAPAGSSDVTTSGGTPGTIPFFSTATDIENSVITQSGAGSKAKIGINTTTPASTLDIKGSSTVRGTLSLPATKAATATQGYDSQPIEQSASAYNSGSGTAVPQNFEWQAEPTGNDTSSPNGTLNLLFAQGSSKLAETGLNIASNGQITFAAGQSFPGTGTVTSVGSGAGLTGGPITGSGTLSVATGGVTNAMLANSSLTVSPGGGMTGGGKISLGGSATLGLENCSANQVLEFISGTWTCTNAGTGTITGVTAGTDLTGGGNSGNVTLNLDTTKVPQLGTANTFTGNQTINGNVSATGVVAGSSYQIGSNLFAFGSYSNLNAFVGFAGSAGANQNTYSDAAVGYGALANDAAVDNTAVGVEALNANTTGYFNTASGAFALSSNTGGTSNTAMGVGALQSNTTGSPNDAFGYQALYSNTLGQQNAAFGYEALYSNTGDNLGQGDGDYNTASGYQALYSNTLGAQNAAFGYQALYSNTGDNLGEGDGSLNTAVGNVALYSNIGGCANTAVGNLALTSNTGLCALSTGSANTAVGSMALTGNTNGSFLTCIGFDCSASGDVKNATAIGAHAVVGQSNSLVLGGTGQYAVKVGIGTTTPSNILTIGRGTGHPVSDSWETYSSRRWKTNIQTLPDALAKVEQLRGVSYDLKDSGKHEIGVIAEEVGAVVPEVVTYEDNGTDARGVDYSRLTALLIEATKEQQKLIRRQQQQIRVQQAQIKTQQTESKLQQARINQQQNQITSQARLSELQQAQIAQLSSQVKAIQATLKTAGRTAGPEVRTVKAQVPMVQ